MKGGNDSAKKADNRQSCADVKRAASQSCADAKAAANQNFAGGTLRAWTEGDFDEVENLERQLIDCPWNRAMLASAYSNPNYTCLVYEHDGRLLAYGGYYKTGDAAEISNIAVSPENQGKGLGRLILNALCDSAKAQKLTSIFLEVGEQNTKAVCLYTSAGLKRVGQRKDYYGKDRHAIILKKEFDAEDFA